MNCFDEIEKVIEYIEGNLNCVDIRNISKLTGVPGGLYQRIFSYVCGVSISEYVRRRKLSEAARDILQKEESIIDIAIRYGYDNHSAFSRAFKEQFGVPPTSLTGDIYHSKFYQRFSFQNEDTYYVMKGRRIMADIVKIEYVDMAETLLIGIAKSNTGLANHELWQKYFEEGHSERLGELEQYQSEDMKEDYIGLGYASEFADERSLGNEYVIGRYFKAGTKVPENMIGKVIPGGIVAKAQIRGKNLEDIINSAYILINDMAGKNGYRLDYDNFYWTEVYTNERYCKPAENGENEIILDWYMPCKKIRDKLN
ncbi:MAG: AraC family transcriptional regulator [Mobilitalea sp.]